MARKTTTYRVEDEGRDKGKLFLLTEMAASKGEAWATRVLLALMASNVDIPEDYKLLGMAALAELGMKVISGLKWHIAEPLLNEMMECVQRIVDPHQAAATTRVLFGEDGQPNPSGDYDIEEIHTRLMLRVEVWNLHMGFLEAVAQSLKGKFKSAPAKKAPSATKTSRE